MLSIGMKIQEFRVKNGLSQEILAEKLSVSRQSVSKWEIGQTLPEVDKIIAMSKLFSVSTDELLSINENLFSKPNKNNLHLGSIYLIVKHFQKSVDFYEKLLSMRVSTINTGIFAEFFFDNKCISLMNESNLHGHDYSGGGDYKFVLNFWIDDLQPEHERVKSLNIGEITEIKQAHPEYYYFHLRDPDNNVIEITGSYKKGVE
jgi:lactoylglutathione lyase